MAVTKQWSECTFRRGEFADEVYWIDAANETAAGFASGLPQPNTSHLQDARLLVQGSPEIKAITPGQVYMARVHYARLRTTAKQEENLLDTPPMIVWRIGNDSVPTDIDVDGNPLINSAGDPLTGQYDSVITLHLEYTRYESTYDIQKALAFSNKTNSDTFSIRGPNGDMRVDPGQALCESISAAPYAVDAEAIRISYNFEFREDGFKWRIIDQGYNGLYTDSDGKKQAARFVDGNVEPIVSPVLLRNGKPIDRAGTQVYVGRSKKTPEAGQQPKGTEIDHRGIGDVLIYKQKKSIPFSPLNL